eukprot:CAMPEP_0206407752 /NCGR_PEP_ID=MMETSP0294-20121207/30703_1 /ASSEMBLY_ACC=CAM_ASM_000327 /TAXON_ID=39354 /ORGANISM="Heterosigma akashiwo, Strain CCMP2393" /LENGTH=49 /DNA_ID= /DNA_START= /DNA_END= /DNA_ORIENTATION=
MTITPHIFAKALVLRAFDEVRKGMLRSFASILNKSHLAILALAHRILHI